MKKINDMKIFFLGTSFFAKEILHLLLKNNLKISCVVTQPDKPAGRRKLLQSSEVKNFSIENNLPLKQTDKINDENFEFFKKENPDLILVAAYGIILPEKLLKIPRFGCLNFHASLLPQLRGPSPIQTALLEGRKATGVTLMKMDELIDHGEIIAKKEVPINPNDDYFSLEKKLAQACEEMLPEILEKYINQEIRPLKQEHAKATYTKIIKKQDGKIDWNISAEEIYNRYRAYKRWPGIFTFWKSKKISLLEIEISREKSNKKPGEVLKTKGKIAVQTKSGLVFIKKIQVEGKRPAEIESFINGYPDFIEANLSEK